MLQIELNYLSILVSGIVIFILGVIWYSKKFFGRQWLAGTGRSQVEIKAGSMLYTFIITFMSALISAYTLAIFLEFARAESILEGIWVAFMCWFGFTGATSFLHYLFAMHPVRLWIIDSIFIFISFIAAALILVSWS